MMYSGIYTVRVLHELVVLIVTALCVKYDQKFYSCYWCIIFPPADFTVIYMNMLLTACNVIGFTEKVMHRQ